MTSIRTRLENVKTRLLFKRFLNSNYQPADLRPRVERGAPVEGSRRLELGDSHLEVWGEPQSAIKILYVPGGGFCFGPHDDYREFLSEIGSQLSAETYLLNYRLAPEHPYPAALDDTIDALLRISGDGVKLVVIGDSAGATLLLCALMKLRDQFQMPATVCSVYLSAFTDLALTGLSMVSNSRRDPLFSAEALIHKVHHYLQGNNPTDPGVSPFWGDTRSLPPSLFLVGDTEVLYDDSARMVEKGRQSGCDFHLRSYASAPHIFPINSKLPEARRAREQIVGFMQKQLEIQDQVSTSP
jgi:epsilon-lactone hydrolase